MSNKTHSFLAVAAIKILKPLVSIFLRNGIEYGTFAEILRKAYVEVAQELIEDQGKRPTVSGISALSGLTRKEAKRLKELTMPASQETTLRFNRSIRVISGWLNDSRFLDSKGKPNEIPIEGSEYSFAELAKSYSGDIPSAAMLNILELSKCVEVKNGRARLLQHAYIPENDPTDKIEILGDDVSELLRTIKFNLSAETGQLKFQRKVSNHRVKLEAIPIFKKLAAKKAQLLLEELDYFLSVNEVDGDQTVTSDNYVALGIYDASQ
ncbi:DUF6502 family protein [Aurantivibrio infirmus]